MAAAVFVPDVIPEKGTLVAPIVDVQIGATPAPDETRNCPELPAVEFGIRAPLNWTFPVTSRPELLITNRLLVSVEPPVRNFNDPDSVACKITSPVPADCMTVALALDKVKSVDAEVDLIPGLEALISRLPSLLIYGMTDVPVPGGSP